MAIDNIRAGPIRNKDIPFLARSCLEEYGATSFPVDLLHITRGMGVKVIKDSDVHDLIPGEYGKTYHEPISGQSIIIYDDTLSLEERRFTVAHEIGHVYMKHWEEHARFMAYIEELKRKHGLHVERQADLFAKHLLKGVNV